MRAAHDALQLLQPRQFLLHLAVVLLKFSLKSRVKFLKMLQYDVPPLILPFEIAAANFLSAVAGQSVVEGLPLAAADSGRIAYGGNETEYSFLVLQAHLFY